MRLIRSGILAVVASVAVFGQTSPAQPEFEVSSIRPSAPPDGQVNVGVHVDGAQVRCTYLSLKDYLRMAYRVKVYQISGPEWLASERFDIAAKLPAGAAGEQIPDMIKSLLAERFQLKMHRETKEFSVYALSVGKGGLKMKESPPDSDADSAGPTKGAVDVTATGGRGGVRIDFARGSYFSFGDNRIEGKKLTMIQFADTLARFVDRPVVDMTELKGNYDFVIEFSPEDYRAMLIRSALTAGVSLPAEALRALDGASGDSLFSGIQGLGLKLEPRKAPLEVLVIDHAEKTPTEN